MVADRRERCRASTVSADAARRRVAVHGADPIAIRWVHTAAASLVELRPLCDLRIFVETPDGICFERRLRRDVEERGRTLESVQRQYDETVRPAAERFIRPSAAHADRVLDGAGALDWKVERVVNEMRTRGLLQRLAG